MAGMHWSKFNWAAYAGDEALATCSMGAQGLWMRLLCICAKSTDTGHLLIGGRRPSIEQLAKLTLQTPEDVATWMAELIDNGVCSRTKGGVLYNRRMVVEAYSSRQSRAAGALGGNPALSRDPIEIDGRSDSVPVEIGERKREIIFRTLPEDAVAVDDLAGPSSGGVNPETETETETETDTRRRVENELQPPLPKGVTRKALKAGARAIWEASPEVDGARRTGVADVEGALSHVVTHGADLAQVVLAIRTYYGLPAHKKRPEFAKSARSLLQEDRWREYVPKVQAPADPAKAKIVERMKGDPEFAAWRQAIMAWSKPEDDGRWWNRDWGPQPDQPGCRLPERFYDEFKIQRHQGAEVVQLKAG